MLAEGEAAPDFAPPEFARNHRKACGQAQSAGRIRHIAVTEGGPISLLQALVNESVLGATPAP
jgi:hypothetical protein